MDVITIAFDSQVLKNAEEHLLLATQERLYYQNAIEPSKEVLKATFTVDEHLQVPPIGSCLPPLSQDIEMHFSLDMAQQVGCMQLNPANKLTRTCKSIGALSQRSTAARSDVFPYTPQMCHLWGVLWSNSKAGGWYKYDAISGNLHVSLFQVNYLIDEAVNTGKGANNINSMLHHFLEEHNLGEANLHLHCDNCSGQSKNRFDMQYLSWRVMVGLNRTITVSFLIVGHTKFSPDWCFGLFKQAFRLTKIGCLDDIVKVVESSAMVNYAQLVGTQNSQVVVPTYDWAEYFNSPFRQNALKGIKAMLHLTFSHLKPGTAVVKDSVSSPEREINLLQD